ncbi:MAG: hypothetical protein COB12_10710 [Flavobacterium sp.]|nr:MAG: hypothetical protein COB12_10710 [Flavobacterium sp.]
MNKHSQYKIVLIGDTLGEGGAERVQARLSFLFENKGVEVHHVIVRNVIEYEYAGCLFNMGLLKSNKNSIWNRLTRLQALKNYLKKHQFDYIIDFRVKNRFLQEYLIANYVYKTPYVMSIRHFNTNYYFPKNNYFASIIYRKAYGIIAVSKALEDRIIKDYNYKNVTTIYNPIMPRTNNYTLQLDDKFIFGIGRMQNNIKQFDHLIKAFKKSEARKYNFKLLLAGDGFFKRELEELVEKEELINDVVFLGHLSDPNPYFKCAYFTALTSKSEGFPNVVLESLVNETPVVAYDCKSGPSEIINNEINGLLVKDQNINEFVLAINKMILNKEIYSTCKKNALSSVEKFNPEATIKNWLQFLKLEV